MDFIDKKEKFADMIEDYIASQISKEELISYIKEISKDSEFMSRSLFENMIKELTQYFDELSRRELKQRILMIRSYIE